MILTKTKKGRVNDARLFTDSSLYMNMLFDQEHYFPGNTILLAGMIP
jgi:hypothetical protein